MNDGGGWRGVVDSGDSMLIALIVQGSDDDDVMTLAMRTATTTTMQRP